MESRRAKVEAGYRCPFCPDHIDEAFVESPTFGRPICEGCSIELDIFMHEAERPADHLIEAIEKFTRQPWTETRNLLLQDDLRLWESLERERPAAFAEEFAHIAPTRDPWAYVRERVEEARRYLQDAETDAKRNDAV